MGTSTITWQWRFFPSLSDARAPHANVRTVPELQSTIYISDSGDGKNGGLSLQTAIYSLERAEKLVAGISGREQGSGSKRTSQRRMSARCRRAFKGALVRRMAVTMDRQCWLGLGGGVCALLV